MSDDMVESIQEELTCAICFDIFDNPVIIGSCMFYSYLISNNLANIKY